MAALVRTLYPAFTIDIQLAHLGLEEIAPSGSAPRRTAARRLWSNAAFDGSAAFADAGDLTIAPGRPQIGPGEKRVELWRTLIALTLPLPEQRAPS
jgi:hypothetical protein